MCPIAFLPFFFQCSYEIVSSMVFATGQFFLYATKTGICLKKKTVWNLAQFQFWMIL